MESQFSLKMTEDRAHSRFFRLIHHLRDIPRPASPPGVTFDSLSLDHAMAYPAVKRG